MTEHYRVSHVDCLRKQTPIVLTPLTHSSIRGDERLVRQASADSPLGTPIKLTASPCFKVQEQPSNSCQHGKCWARYDTRCCASVK